MKPTDNRILIPLDVFFKELNLSGSRRRSRRKILKSLDAIVKIDNKQHLSLIRYVDARTDHLDAVGRNAKTSKELHVLEFYAAFSLDALFEWILLTQIFIESIPDSLKTLSISELKQAFDKILDQHVNITKHNAAAKKRLFKFTYMIPKVSDTAQKGKKKKRG